MFALALAHLHCFCLFSGVCSRARFQFVLSHSVGNSALIEKPSLLFYFFFFLLRGIFSFNFSARHTEAFALILALPLAHWTFCCFRFPQLKSIPRSFTIYNTNERLYLLNKRFHCVFRYPLEICR